MNIFGNFEEVTFRWSKKFGMGAVLIEFGQYGRFCRVHATCMQWPIQVHFPISMLLHFTKRYQNALDPIITCALYRQLFVSRNRAVFVALSLGL
jgi:hypothetical protein